MTVLAPKHLFMLLCAAMPIQMLYYWLLQRAIPPKSKKAYWVVGVSLSLVVAALRPIMPEVLRGSFGMVLSVLVPIFLLGGPLVRRISVCCIGMICMAVGELSGGLFWIAVTGLEVMSPDYAFANAGAYVASGDCRVSGMVMTPCMLGLAKLLPPVLPRCCNDGGFAEGVWKRRRTRRMCGTRMRRMRGGRTAPQVSKREWRSGCAGAQAVVEVGVQAAAEVACSDRPSEGGTGLVASAYRGASACAAALSSSFFAVSFISYTQLRGETHYVVWSAPLCLRA